MRGFVSLGNTTVVCRLPGDRELTSASSYLKKIQPLEGSARPACCLPGTFDLGSACCKWGDAHSGAAL